MGDKNHNLAAAHKQSAKLSSDTDQHVRVASERFTWLWNGHLIVV